MAWQTEMVTILRAMIDDMCPPFRYSDNRLERVIVAAAQMVTTDGAGKFLFDFQADATEVEITPDPTDRDGGTRDDDFITLTLLKAGCFIDNCAAREAARKGGITVREWSTSIDTKGIFGAAFSLLESKKGWCQQYEDGLLSFLVTAASNIGVGVFGPFRLIYNAYNASPGYTYSNNELFNDFRR